MVESSSTFRQSSTSPCIWCQSLVLSVSTGNRTFCEGITVSLMNCVCLITRTIYYYSSWLRSTALCGPVFVTLVPSFGPRATPCDQMASAPSASSRAAASRAPCSPSAWPLSCCRGIIVEGHSRCLLEKYVINDLLGVCPLSSLLHNN